MVRCFYLWLKQIDILISYFSMIGITECNDFCHVLFLRSPISLQYIIWS